MTEYLGNGFDWRPVVVQPRTETTAKCVEAVPLKHLVNKAASGDLRALQQLTPLANSVEQMVDPPAKKLSADDAKVFESFLKRIKGFNEGEDNDN